MLHYRHYARLTAPRSPKRPERIARIRARRNRGRRARRALALALAAAVLNAAVFIARRRTFIVLCILWIGAVAGIAAAAATLWPPAGYLAPAVIVYIEIARATRRTPPSKD